MIILTITVILLLSLVIVLYKKIYNIESRFNTSETKKKNLGVYFDFTDSLCTHKYEYEDITALIETVKNENWDCIVKIDKEYDNAYCIDFDLSNPTKTSTINSRMRIRNKVSTLVWFRLRSTNPSFQISFDDNNLDQRSNDDIVIFLNMKVEERKKNDEIKKLAAYKGKKEKLAIITQKYKKSQNIDTNIGKLLS